MRKECRNGHPRIQSNLNKAKRCKVCARKAHNRYNKKNPEVLRRGFLRYKKKNPEKLKESLLKCKYGMTLRQFECLKRKQNNRCAICKVKFGNTRMTGPNVDHRHDGTKNHRALLCFLCNVGLGAFKDQPSLLKRAMVYLRSWNN